MRNTSLGLDLGTNSIGWALLEEDDNGNARSLVDCGVRIFQEAVEAKTRTPKNIARREARSARRRLERKKRRKLVLLERLVEYCILPADETARQAILNPQTHKEKHQLDPWVLRTRGLDERLTLEEFGRVLHHLNQRRGFLSNRKTDKQDDETSGKVKPAIAKLRESMSQEGARTLGEYLASLPTRRNRFSSLGLYTDRAMFHDEFNTLWEAQAVHYPTILTDERRIILKRIILEQRPLRIQKYLIGYCSFEPTKQRAARALLPAQLFRIWQEVNQLTYFDPTTYKQVPLTLHQKEILVNKLEKVKQLTWDQVRRLFKPQLTSNCTFNLERGRKKDIQGISTVAALAGKKGPLEAYWDRMDEEVRESLIADLVNMTSEAGLLRRLMGYYGFNRETALSVAEIKPGPDGYLRLSLKAIRKILPHLKTGLLYDKACEQAGYKHYLPAGTMPESDLLGPPDNLRNPVVMKALHETRKVVNALVRKHGIPATVRVEMARDMKQGKKQRETTHRKQKENEAKRDRARKLLKEDFVEFRNREPKRDDILRFQLWEECKYVCPYTNTPISREMLFSPAVEIEHILPWSRCYDDSYMNKTLCMQYENRHVKRNRTPWEAYHDAMPERFRQILLRISRDNMPDLPEEKRKRFSMPEIPDDFRERQLTDTRYICTEVVDYLAQLGVSVEVSRGQATAALRRRWDLNRILAPAGQDGEELMKKNRSDHRHHTVDAIVIALTNRSLLHKLSTASAQASDTLGHGVGIHSRYLDIPDPWPGYWNDIRSGIEGIVVSHATSRKISGALHAETVYGLDGEGKAKPGQAIIVHRVRLDSLTDEKKVTNFLKKVRDDAIREMLLEHYHRHGNNPKVAFGNSEKPVLHKDGITPIRSVRVEEEVKLDSIRTLRWNEKGRPARVVQTGSNHHVEIIENLQTGKREGRFITTFDAAERARKNRGKVVQIDHGPEWKFIMSLMINDMVEIVNEDTGKVLLYRVQKMSGPINQITLRLHTEAMLEADKLKADLLIGPDDVKRTTPNTLRCRKIAVSPHGEVSLCND